MNSNLSATPVKKQKHRISPCLIVAACVFLVSVVFFVMWSLLFQKSIVGTWEVTFTDDSADEAIVYNLKFDFDSMTNSNEDNAGNVTINLGNISYFGTYRFIDDTDGEPQIWIYSILDGDVFINSHLAYEIEGNALTGKTLKLTDIEGYFIPVGTDTSFEMTPSSIEYNIKKLDDAKQDKAILGSWVSNTSTVYSYTFNNDNSFSVSSKYLAIVGSYSAADGEILLCYYNSVGELMEETIPYTVSDSGEVSFNEMEFSKKN